MVEEVRDGKCLQDSLAAAQLEKLNLEIKQLKSNSGFEKRVASYIPLLSVILAVCGFLFGIYQFQQQYQGQQNQLIAEQQKERFARDTEQAIRIQNQIRSNVEQILQFPSDNQQTISRLSFLLQDLRSYIELNPDKSQPTPQTDHRSISVTLYTSVSSDCNFDEHRDVIYASTLIDQWKDYGDYLRGRNDNVEYVLSMYNEAANNFYLKDTPTIKTVQYDKAEDEFFYPKGYGKLTVAQVYHFNDIVVGFETYLKLLQNEKDKQRYLRKFQSSICNGKFVEQFFGVKFKPQDYPNELSGCP